MRYFSSNSVVSILLILLMIGCSKNETHQENMQSDTNRENDITMDSHMPYYAEKINVAVMLYEGAILYDWAPSAEIFRVAEMGSRFNVYSVSETGNPVQAMFPASINVDYSISDAPDPDIIIVPGGNWMGMKEGHEPIFNWLAGNAEAGTDILGVCTGVYVLALSGVIKDNTPITSLHIQLDILRDLAPKADIRDDVPFIISENIITTAGAQTAIDAALEMVALRSGEDVATWISHTYLDYDKWER